MEQALRAHELKRCIDNLAGVFDRAPDSISVADLSGNLVYQNRTAEKYMGCPVDEFNAGGGLPSLFTDPEIAEDILTAAVTGRKWVGEVEVKNLRGDNMLALLKASGITGSTGEVIGILGIISDIRQQVAAREALLRSEAYFRSLIENAHDTIVVLDWDGSLRYASPSFQRTYGFSPEEVIGSNSFELVHPDDREMVSKIFQQGLKREGYTVSAVYRVKHKHGGWRWVEVKGKNLLDDPAVAGVVINSIDVTERRKYEEALRASEQKLRIVTDNMMDMVSQVDMEGRYEFMGRSHQEYLGYDQQALIGRSIFEFVHPDDLERIINRYMRGLEEKGTIKIDFRYRRVDGRYIWVESICNPFLDESGEINGAIIGSRDITERKRTEERLASLNGCFLSLGADFRDNIEVLVASGREILDGVLLVYYRPSDDKLANAFAAWSEDGLYISGLVRERLMKEVGARGAGQPYVVEGIEGSEYEALMPDLARFGIKRLMACAVMLKERLTGFLCLLDREEVAFTREEAEMMGMLARSISIEEERWAYEEALRDFINITSHELRHPITLMKGYSEVLSSFGGDLDEETRRKALNAIDRGTIRLEKLVSALLDTSRIERGSFLIQKKDVELNRLIEEVAEEMLIKGSPHYFELELPDSPLFCGADPEKLTQLLVILLENAVKYAPEDSAITVEAREENGAVVVSVTDRGPGVPVEERKRIFDRLYQVGDAIYHSAPGIGLGLYIARKIVEAHGGLIWHEPNPEGGSTFSFLLP